MSTRSEIGILKDSGEVEAIYCHWDGYPSGVGRTLAYAYATTDMAKRLIALGSVSSLGILPSQDVVDFVKTMHESRNFKGEAFDIEDVIDRTLSALGTTLSYNMWRNEEISTTTYTYDDYMTGETGAVEFRYLWIPKEKQWICRNYVGNLVSLYD